MTYRIPTVPLRGAPPKLTREQQEWLHYQSANRKPKRHGVSQVGQWAAELGVHIDTCRRYLRREQKFPVRA